MTETKQPAKTSKVFSDAELEAMQDLKRERKRGGKPNGEADLRAAIEKLSGDDKAMTERLHELVMASAPSLSPKTWYGLPAWANAEGKVVVFFTPASKFKERYGSLGFGTASKLDDGNMWPTSFALLKLGTAEEKQIAALVKRAAG